MFEDQRLIWQLKTGRQEALVRIYDKYRRYLLKIAHGLVTDVSQAEDVVQDVFVALVRSTPSLRVDGNLRGYLVRCLVNRVQDLKRGRRPSSLPDGDIAGVEEDRPERWVVQTEEARSVNDALALLPDDQRTTIILHVRGGLKFREIARLQSVSINTVQSRYRYGLAKLRNLLNGQVKP
jgi:RNA polymerase sigma-70 factor (ECF subfamily)